MVSVRPASLYCLLVVVCVVVSASAAETNISAAVGDSVTLPCKASNNSIRVMWWSRPDQEPKYVLMYRDEQFDPEEQHPSFKNRVDLQDSLMKDGNVSLILKDAKITDAGTYKCRVSMGGTNRRKRSIVETDPISVINLSVAPPAGQPGGPFAVVAGLLVSGTLVLVVGGVVFFLLFKKSKDQKR
ncbi:programmed cell death 1 ligand 1-like [Archocentrus centrarchus]|uniref:programmed cell death 1 ligand 1-like n=1 Tax=Archocentrus centrarchus TaxID=63155 RepID=UPI0011EA3558|nr:programmed cell death 1 ligand 1-like [Archocentrus centrarchus]